jgi:hypothetical protein
MDQNDVLEIALELSQSTEDEDIRQDVWIEILETGNRDPQAHLDRVIKERDIKAEVENRVKALILLPPSEGLLDAISELSSNQQSIVILLMLGYPTDYIARYKNMCNLRFARTLKCIAEHNTWEKYLAKEKSKRI